MLSFYSASVIGRVDRIMQEDYSEPSKGEGSEGDKNAGAFSQPFQNQPVAARVPTQVAKGIFTTGVVIQDGANEFVLDFLQGLSRPPQVAGRVVLSPGVMDCAGADDGRESQ